jgi:7,8-dihydropterin-6-yl-methyl-4-(beta-D-ribofuranosyl)aminobenzene 5'-phosphate synthase
MRVSVLVNDISKGNIKAQHGLSFLIELDNITILMDTGASPDVLMHNAREMKTGIEYTDVVVLSHGHYDHVGGLFGVLNITEKKPLPIVMHPSAIKPKLSLHPRLRYIGAPYRWEEVEKAGGVLLFATSPLKLSQDSETSGEIPRRSEFEKVEGFWTLERGALIPDLMMDDMSLIVRTKRGPVVFTGCAHAGIANILNMVVEMFGEVHGLVGGFHLFDANEERIIKTVEILSEIEPEIILPCHCTGKNAIEIMKEMLEGVQPLKAGDIIEI